MVYLLALIGLVTVIVLLWKAFGSEGRAPVGRVSGPDDDPDFLWKLGRDSRKGGSSAAPERPDDSRPDT